MSSYKNLAFLRIDEEEIKVGIVYNCYDFKSSEYLHLMTFFFFIFSLFVTGWSLQLLFLTTEGKKENHCSYLITSFLLPTSRNHKCLDCLFVIIALDRRFTGRSLALSLSLAREIWQTNAPKLFNSLHVQIISPSPPTPPLFLFLRHRPPSVELVVNLAMLWVLALN